MITEAIASYYTRIAERWMVSRDVNTHPEEFPPKKVVNSITLQNPFEKRTDFSKFVVPKDSDLESSFWK